MRVICIEGNDIYHRTDCYWANEPWVKNVNRRRVYPSIEAARRENLSREQHRGCKERKSLTGTM